MQFAKAIHRNNILAFYDQVFADLIQDRTVIKNTEFSENLLAGTMLFGYRGVYLEHCDSGEDILVGTWNPPIG